MNVKGIARYTFAQDQFNQHTDYIERDNDGNVVGMWCDYFVNGDVIPTAPKEEPQNIYSVVSCSGLKPDIKSGGHYKKFTVNFFKENEPIDFRDGVWTFTIDGVDVSDKVKTLDSTESTDVANNQIKAKLDADNSIIGRILVVSFESNDGIKSDIEINILGN